MRNYVGSAASVIQVRMETNDERRKRKLAQLCQEEGGVEAVARRAGLKWQNLDQILKGVLLPEKADGTRAPRGLGDPAARAIELAYEKGRGWFDWPLDLVDFRRYWNLQPEQRGVVQQAMMDKINELVTPDDEKRFNAVRTSKRLPSSGTTKPKKTA